MSTVCVCISTHDRPDGLRMLLTALLPQLKDNDAALVIVDNGKTDAAAVARAVLQEFPYACVKLNEPGLVASRNRALLEAQNTAAPLIAFIDDDEVPDDDWLASLVLTLQGSGADLCFGPLRPSYEQQPPHWAEDGRFFWKTGRTFGTGNMIMRSSILSTDPSGWFQPAFAFIGGEDEEFFARLVANGAKVVTAENAWVSETVPASRLNLSYIRKTGARDGEIEIALMRHRNLSGPALWLAAMRHVLKKAGYMLYHLALLWQGSWHGVAALRDAAEMAGTIKALLGGRGTYYGQR